MLSGAATVPADPGSPSYQQGSADRDSWEVWFGSLTGAQLDGANFWAGQRSLKSPVPCSAHSSYGDNWLAGCIEAKRRLTQPDFLRRTDPQYWNGWNKTGIQTTGVELQNPSAGNFAPNDNSRPRPGWIGVRLQQMTPEMAQQVGLRMVVGVLVTNVSPGNAAERAGIRGGDVILGFAGQRVNDISELSRLVADTPPGKQVTALIWRNWAEQVVAVVPGEKPRQDNAEAKPAAARPNSGQKVAPTEVAPIEAPPPSQVAVALGADSEAAITHIIDEFADRYRSAPNDMAKGLVRRDRALTLCKIVAPANGMVREWAGTVETLSATGDGRGVLAVRISQHVVLTTTNNSLSETISDFKSLIDPDSPLFQDAVKLALRQQVVFSGTLDRSLEDCMKEMSLTASGGMNDPEFRFRFASIRPSQ